MLSSTTKTSRPQLTESATTPGEMYRSRVWEDLRELYQQDHLTDVMLAAEGRPIPCHKVLLAAASKFFFEKFITNPESLEDNTLNIDGIDFDTLTSVVSYIYSGNIELSVGKTEKLLPASVSLMLPELTKECGNFLGESNSDKSDCVAVYKTAEGHAMENTWETMLDNFQDTIATSAFKELSETEVQKYISDKDLNVANEDPVFEAVVTWVRHDMKNRKDRFENLLDHVALSHCSLDFLKDVAMQEPLMQNFSCFQAVAKALASHASSQSLHHGTPRKVQHNDNSLVAICGGWWYVLREGELEWLDWGSLTSRYYEYDESSRSCRAGDRILVLGGQASWDYTNKCCKFTLPTLESSPMSELQVERGEHASVCVGGQVYVLGGLGKGGNLPVQSVEYLDEKTGSWCVTTDMPVALSEHTAVAYKHYIYVFGGKNESETSKGIFVLDTVSKKWDKRADMPQGCTMGSSVVYKDRIYVLGGWEDCCMSYNPDQDQWQSHSRPREDHCRETAIVWGDRILLCGGRNTTVIEEYNPDTDTWTDWKHSLPNTGCDAVFMVQL